MIDERNIDDIKNTLPPIIHWLLVLLLASVGVMLAYALFVLPKESVGLAGLVQQQLPQSGVENPVTAVLLNFRGYDTLLEMGVLLLALLGVWSLQSEPQQKSVEIAQIPFSLVQILVPLMIMLAAYLLWVGAHAPGGAFQAGSVLAAAIVLCLMFGLRFPERFLGWQLRLLLILGLTVFVAVAGLMLLHGKLLHYPVAWAGGLILLIETAATLSIAVTLAALFIGARPRYGE